MLSMATSLTASSNYVPCRECNSSLVSQIFPFNLRKLWSHFRVLKHMSLVRILSQIKPVHTYFNNTPPYIFFRIQSFPPSCPSRSCVHFFLSHTPLFKSPFSVYHPNITRRGVLLEMLSVVQISPDSCYFFTIGSEYTS